MTKLEFINEIRLMFEGEEDFDLYNCAEDNPEIVIPSVDVKISLNDDNTFNIYRDFCYPTYDSDENFTSEYMSTLEEVTSEMLEDKLTEAPFSESDSCMGCPFDASLLGYWSKVREIEFVKQFVEICRAAELVDVTDRVAVKINETLALRAESSGLSEFSADVYTDTRRQIFVFVKDINQVKIENIDVETIELIAQPVMSWRYFCGITENAIPIAVNKKKFVIFSKVCDYFNYDMSNCDYYCVNGKFLYIKGLISALISLSLKADEIVDTEYSLMIRKAFTLKSIRPSVSALTLDFSHLSCSDFESLCYQILMAKGFQNVHPVGKTNAPDGGKDILADEEYQTLTGTEHRKWLWQCKHSKNSLSRKDVSEIGELMEENKASAYGLFCSNTLTPDLIDRLEHKKDRNIHIVYYGKVELTTLLSQHPDIIAKYKLIGGDGI
jgi:hypothetical protein